MNAIERDRALLQKANDNLRRCLILLQRDRVKTGLDYSYLTAQDGSISIRNEHDATMPETSRALDTSVMSVPATTRHMEPEVVSSKFLLASER